MAYATTTYLAIAALTSIAGAGVSYYGSQQQAKAAKATSEYNAEIQRQQALKEKQAGDENMRRQQTENRRMLARVRSAQAASGFTTEGSQLAVLGDVATDLELRVLDIGNAAENRARSLISGANLSLYEGRQRSRALKTTSYAQLLGSASSTTTGFLTSSGTV